MTESQVRTLFNQIAEGETGPARVDTQLLLRRGRARLRWRRACLAGAPVLAAATTAAVILAVVAGPFRIGPGPVTADAGPAAPRQFNPVIPYVSFGWLPAGESLYSGETRPAQAFLAAGPRGGLPQWSLSVYARGQCHLTPPGSLQCPYQGRDATAARFKITKRAPAVDGHRAFWARAALVWQYARAGWAALTWPGYPPGAHAPPHVVVRMQHEAIKIAGHVRYGAATAPLLFPTRLTGLAPQWQISDVYYVPYARVLRADSYMLTTRTSRYLRDVGDLGVWTNAPYIQLHPHYGTCDPHDPASKNTSEIINGYRVVVKRMPIGGVPQQELCAAHADGFWLSIIEFGAHPSIQAASLLRHHLHLLGTNPANWTGHPLN